MSQGDLLNYNIEYDLAVFEDIFKFLLLDFEFTLISSGRYSNKKGKHLLIYRNSNLQVEIYAEHNYFHTEFRRLINGLPVKYSDKKNNIGFESLAILESNNQYDHFDYFAGGKTGLQGVVKNTVELFSRNKIFFTTDCWIDTDRLNRLKNEEFEKKFGKIEHPNDLSFFEQIKKPFRELMIKNGYKLIFDNTELPPYDSRSFTERIIFKKNRKQIEISQLDWRDAYNTYSILLNGNEVFQKDLSETNVKNAIDLILTELEKVL